MTKVRQKCNKPLHKGLYAWNYIHAGSFLLFVENYDEYYKFLFLPGPMEYFLTKQDFSDCIESNTLEFVESLPNDIFEESVKFSLQCPPQSSIISFNEKVKTKQYKQSL